MTQIFRSHLTALFTFYSILLEFLGLSFSRFTNVSDPVDINEITISQYLQECEEKKQILIEHLYFPESRFFFHNFPFRCKIMYMKCELPHYHLEQILSRPHSPFILKSPSFSRNSGFFFQTKKSSNTHPFVSEYICITDDECKTLLPVYDIYSEEEGNKVVTRFRQVHFLKNCDGKLPNSSGGGGNSFFSHNAWPA